MGKYAYTYSVYNTENKAVIAKGFESKARATELLIDVHSATDSTRYAVRQHRLLLFGLSS